MSNPRFTGPRPMLTKPISRPPDAKPSEAEARVAKVLRTWNVPNADWLAKAVLHEVVGALLADCRHDFETAESERAIREYRSWRRDVMRRIEGVEWRQPYSPIFRAIAHLIQAADEAIEG